MIETFSNKPISKSEFVEYSGLTNRTAEKLLKRFVDLELIKTKDSGRKQAEKAWVCTSPLFRPIVDLLHCFPFL